MASSSVVRARSTAGRNLLVLNAVGVLAILRLLAKVGFARRTSLRFLIMSVRAATPLACLLVIRNATAVLRSPNSFSVRRLCWYAVSAWSVAETIFLVYIMNYWRQLDAQTTRRWRAVLAHSTEEKRRASMERYLLMIAQVFRGGSESQSTDSALSSVIEQGKTQRLRRRSNSVEVQGQAMEAVIKSMNKTNQKGLFGGLSSASLSFSNSRSKLSQASVGNLLKEWEDGSNKSSRNQSGKALSDAEFRRLKLLELAGWFEGADKDLQVENPELWLRKGNLEDWIAHYWFRGSTPEELLTRPREGQELNQLVDLVLDFTGLSLPEGRNPRIRARLMMSDRLPVLHRPLFCYVGTALLCPLMTSQVMQFLGFRREKVGGLCYWHRDARNIARPETDIAGPRQIPLVFVHGLGVGLVPYYLFIARLSKRYSGELFVPEMPFMAMVPWETVPSAREIVAQLQDMLAANRHTAAHFVAHSFGCTILSWMMKMSRSSILCTTFMEPASVLTLKSDFIASVLWESPKTAVDIFLRYFVFRELFTVNLICRNSFWEQSQMWPEEVSTPALVQLAEDDVLVQSLFVRRLLEHERTARRKQKRESSRKVTGTRLVMASTGSSIDVRGAMEPAPTNEDKPLEIMYIPGFFHGQILFHRRQTEKLFSKMRQMVQASS